MLIFPMTGRISWRNPPFLTIFLILANCLVFFWGQAGDDGKHEKALEFYIQSGLAEMETSRFVEYLKTEGRPTKLFPGMPEDKPDPKLLPYLYQKMQQDRVFMKRLRNDEIITPQDPTYSQWKSLNKKFEEMLSETAAMKYGYKPADGHVRTAFTYMFLHGGLLHLIGNMVFLWIAGCMLELGGSRVVYAFEYLLTGLISALVFGLIYSDSAVPLVGASGAIAGLIGAFTVLYGRMRVKVFYSLGFYFNYARVPAIALLPIWIGNEFIQLFWGGESNVAYVAHIGGLTSGALLGLAQIKLCGGVKEGAISDEDRRERSASLVEKGLQRLSELDLAGARTFMEEALKANTPSSDCSILTHLFNIDKLSPGSDNFHTTTERLLICLHGDSHEREALFDVYQEYCRLGQKPGLSPDLYARLCSTLSHCGHVEESAKIMAHLLRYCPQYSLVPTALLNLIRAYLKEGAEGKAEKCAQLLCRKYPDSAEAHVGRSLLKERI